MDTGTDHAATGALCGLTGKQMYINSELGKTPKWVRSAGKRIKKVALPVVGFATTGVPGAAWGRAKAIPKGAPGTAQRRRYQRGVKVAQRTSAASAAVAAGAVAVPYVGAAAGGASSLIPKIAGGASAIAKAFDTASARSQNGAGNGSGGTGSSTGDTAWLPLLLGGAALLLFGGF